jgi:hypothetical protein
VPRTIDPGIGVQLPQRALQRLDLGQLFAQAPRERESPD